MIPRLALTLTFALVLTAPAQATKWGRNAFGDQVAWSDFIVVARVKSVERLDVNRKRQFESRTADITVDVEERLKGSLRGTIRIRALDMGDDSLNASPWPALDDDLVGQQLLLFLADKRNPDGSFQGATRGVIQDGLVSRLIFEGLWLNKYPLEDVRAMVAELALVQRSCPREPRLVVNEAAAVAACHTALHSKYEPVAWYGARRLLQLPLSPALVQDLIILTQKQDTKSQILYLLVQCLGRARSRSAVPALIDVLRKLPRDPYVPKALKEITGQDFGNDADKWAEWWQGAGRAQP